MGKLLTPREWMEADLAEWRKERDRLAATPEAIEARRVALEEFLAALECLDTI